MAKVGFARVSTKSQSLQQQIEALTKSGCTKIFTGTQSGKSIDNEKLLSELLGYVRSGDTVTVTKLDRLGRSLSRILLTVEELTVKGINLITLDGQIDTTDNSPMGKAMLSLMGTFAELERDIIVDRLQTGRINSKKLGGRKPTLTPEQQQEIKQLSESGINNTQLAKQFSTTRQTIIRTLKK